MWKIFANSTLQTKKQKNKTTWKASNQKGWLFMTSGFKSSWRILCCAQCTQYALWTSVCKTPDCGEHGDDSAPPAEVILKVIRTKQFHSSNPEGKQTHTTKRNKGRNVHTGYIFKKNYTQLNVHVYKIFSTSCKYVIIFRFYQ